jgi:serine-type D-Ala-D-Ala carboxypeptidase/endopeptidase (penicillin-binding protein 4)
MNLGRFDAMKQFPILFIALTAIFWQACSPSRSIGKFTQSELLKQSGLASAQVGISIYDPANSSYLYNYQGDKYFIPASNTKLFSLYAGMKYLGDSLVGIRYLETDTALFILPSGDPTLLHPAFPIQPVIGLLKKTSKNIYLLDGAWQENAFGRGWAWDDYNDDYMSERSPLPVYGNVIRWVEEGKKKESPDAMFDASPSFYSIPDVDWKVNFTTDTARHSFFVQRDWHNNVFTITEGREKYKAQDVPFITDGVASALVLLKDTIGKMIVEKTQSHPPRTEGFRVLHTQPVDSLFAPTMHLSDNFFAEQTLLMASNEHLGIMNDARMIDTLLKSDLKDLPQMPVWVDGSGLSRYNGFTPQDFVWLLNKMKNEFGLPRLKSILPTGGSGTLGNYYKQDSGYIYAKTGSLSGVVALSGFLVTKKDHLLIFSILINNHHDPAVRKKMEKLIHMIRDNY